MTLKRHRAKYRTTNSQWPRGLSAGSAQKTLLLTGILLAATTLAAPTASASGLPMIDTVNLGAAPAWATFQSSDHRIAVTSDGIFMSYLANWNSTSSTGETVIARSTDEGLSWTTLLTIEVTEHRPASLEADSAGNVYAVQPNVATGPHDAYMYIFPKSQNFANDGSNYLDLPQAGSGKVTTAYDPSTNELFYADHIDLFRIALGSTTASQDTYTEEDVFGTGACGAWVEYPQIYVDRSGSGLILLGMTLSAKPEEWYEDRFMVSTDNGQTWTGQNGTITNFPIQAGCSDDPSWPINTPGQVQGASDSLWLDNAYVQDGKFLFTYTDGSQLEYRQFDWATKSFDETIAPGTCLSSGSYCQDGLGGFFSGNGTPGSRIYFTAPNLESNELYTIYSDDDGTTWHDLAKTAVPLGGSPYAASGTPALDSQGHVVGAVTALTHGYDSNNDELFFFHTNIG